MSYSDADIDSFTITSRSEIVFYLHQLINDQEPLSVMFEEGRESMLTIALDLSEEKNQLILDWGGSEETNKRLLKAGSTSFVANPLGVRNLFPDRRGDRLYISEPPRICHRAAQKVCSSAAPRIFSPYPACHPARALPHLTE
ncbi:MAG: flagellar brake protein [Rhodocyclaceae bacterium]|nr:flagellar brake protein [Rhodocyclaceae bacterium]